MNIKTLEQGIVEKEPIRHSIHICFATLDFERWNNLRARLRNIDKKLKIQEFGRIAIRDMLDNLEKIVEKHENKISNIVE